MIRPPTLNPEKIKFWKKARVIKSSKEIPRWVNIYRRWVYGLALMALILLIVESGLRWQLPASLRIFSRFIDYGVFLTFLFDAAITFYYTVPKRNYIRSNWLDLMVFLPFILNIITVRAGTGFIVLRNFLVLIKVFTRTRKFTRILRGIRLNTAQIITISFAAVILIGTIVLTFPSATSDGMGTGFVDALFTSTSATCVTGLIVQDTPTYFSRFGQIVILVLIQLGGLGIMTYSAFVALIFGRFSLGQRKIVQEMFEEEQNVLGMIYYIFKMTFLIEVAGTLLLFARFLFHFNDPMAALYTSIFHSISAFCNAGFSLFSDSLSGFVADPMINIVIMCLIILGGIGFLVVNDIAKKIKDRQHMLSAHSNLVISTSSVFILIGFIAIFFFEFDNGLPATSLPAKIWGALFQSVTTRTAGFNTIDIGGLSTVSLTIMILLMFIGASPGSTGGGIKTSTFAILVLSIRSILRGKGDIEIYKKTISTSSVLKAVALLVSALIVVSLIFLVLLSVERKPYLDLLFETVSAFGTVGLSTGITPQFTILGKLLIIFLMFLGRIGPLTLVIALANKVYKARIRYPEARILIG